ncbi:MAG: 3-dehydroquinate synthase [Cyclobacteriaceae bacterium]|nr:3-dehydroquinate synthase [Cyclobacteriaceae bacterium]UYN86374.1 MAG: 3-dehydroquinate synthase [Cyclobacteriaceae bacterium]
MLPNNIKLTDNPGPFLNLYLQKWSFSKVMLLADENTQTHCYPLLQSHLPDHTLISVPSGEENKTLKTCEEIWTQMTNLELDRHSILVVLGGGVLGDMGGFCAATYKRGIDFILVPTTLLAMADASIGGKLGIDFLHLKNHIGIFKEPRLTIINSDFLKTLPPAELRSGFAEVIKHALISDRTLWNELRSNALDNQPWDVLLRHSAEFKSSVVQQDPTEQGLRKILNAGHTIGHALESYCLKQGNKILHGEAVAAGLVAEAWLSMKRGMLSEIELNEISGYILKEFGKLNIGSENLPVIAGLCSQDKKNKGKRILCVLSEGIGKARWDCEVTEDEIVDALAFYASNQI